MRMGHFVNFKEELKRRTEEAEHVIREYLPEESGFAKTMAEAMNYSMTAGGKRLRPILIRETYELFGGSRRSLEYATDYLRLPKNRDFHRALADASYTARILLEIDEACMIRHPSLDVYQNPKSRDSEIYISYTDHDKFVSREFVSKERLMKDRTMVSTMCPICRCPAKRKIRWFSTNNSKVYYSLALCHEHGPVAGKIRIRKTDEGKYFGVKTLRAEDTEAADEIREKHESLRRRKMLRSQEKI